MIYPTRKAIVLAAVGVPASLAVGLVAPGFWLASVGWIALVAGLLLADVALGAPPRRMTLALTLPGSMNLGETAPAEAACVAAGGSVPDRVEFALESDERLAATPERQVSKSVGGRASAVFQLEPRRRGRANVDRLWARWTGPLGLVWRQATLAEDHVVAISPNVAAVEREAMRFHARDAQFGLKMQLDRGDGSEFQSLTEYRSGMDRRTIDWKQSARHTGLLAKEFRVERNHNIVLTIDMSRQMSGPLAGLARVDHAINAALLLAYVSLKMGDRAGLFAFDSRPRVAMRPTAGVSSFPMLLRQASAIDYSSEEVNYTLALTTLGAELQRRSLVVVFTEFVDTTSAQLMIDAIARLAKRHLVLFVAFRDEDLEQLTRAEPQTAEDVSRAVIALSLLKERDTLIARLRRLGVQVVDAPTEALGTALVNRYIDLKRREAL